MIQQLSKKFANVTPDEFINLVLDNEVERVKSIHFLQSCHFA
jgi:hypothetical protein